MTHVRGAIKSLKSPMIFEITINELREIDLIKIKLDDSLVKYIGKEEGVPIKGIPSFLYKKYYTYLRNSTKAMSKI